MNRPDPKKVKQIACIGAGTIGGGFVAQFLASGYDVTAQDPGTDARDSVERLLEQAWPVLEQIGLRAGASRDRFRFTPDIEEAVAGAEFVQESVPEDLELKVRIYEKLDELVPPEIVIGSSTSGFPMTEIQRRCKYPERTVVAHPVNPPYLIPLIEIVGGEKTDNAVLDWATAFYEASGKRVLRMEKEIYGFMINRLQTALFREAIHMVAAEQATVAQIDDCLTHGLGLRWACMGPFATFHLAAGDRGLGSFMDAYASSDWRAPYVTESPLPDWTPKLRERIVQQAEEIICGRTIPQMIEERNDTVIGLLKLREASRVNASKRLQRI
ncbi:carnitine 3-dehydrogenase [Mesorhizobium sp. SARCC-RB16n]|uniref:3-hydroxyacyl-CoA dehydrogenase NAD-binding domain-containing protein n=1 Tax=Mesorhizobium sp. SARCC-RB16n TaxID=2116687 RepID=UPI00122EEF55|nr:3-hydroxyacyl-CoA dehydrogenase NAD-binding domain-containing protein [Mesorhizobium sp. SARCC-RB16n]KAA3446911.1 carnitine 3-dehydrogenase [Mesorhizobium sp. SARCC-RB16n]